MVEDSIVENIRAIVEIAKIKASKMLPDEVHASEYNKKLLYLIESPLPSLTTNHEREVSPDNIFSFFTKVFIRHQRLHSAYDKQQAEPLAIKSAIAELDKAINNPLEALLEVCAIAASTTHSSNYTIAGQEVPRDVLDRFVVENKDNEPTLQKPVPKGPLQDEAILEALKALGYDGPENIPQTPPGVRGARAKVWESVKHKKYLFYSEDAFKHAWRRVRNNRV